MVEEIKDVANKAVTALQGTPMLLVLTLINVGVLAMLTYLLVVSSNLRSRERTELIALLKECVQQTHDKHTDGS